MCGGYVQSDRCPGGCNDASAYRIWHWGCIDTFVYFRCPLILCVCLGGGSARGVLGGVLETCATQRVYAQACMLGLLARPVCQ